MREGEGEGVLSLYMRRNVRIVSSTPYASTLLKNSLAMPYLQQ